MPSGGTALWQMPKTIEALRIGLLKIRISKTRIVPRIVPWISQCKRYDTRLVEENHSGFSSLLVPTEVEAFRLRVGENRL